MLGKPEYFLNENGIATAMAIPVDYSSREEIKSLPLAIKLKRHLM
jgi:hypothetical protein